MTLGGQTVPSSDDDDKLVVVTPMHISHRFDLGSRHNLRAQSSVPNRANAPFQKIVFSFFSNVLPLSFVLFDQPYFVLFLYWDSNPR